MEEEENICTLKHFLWPVAIQNKVIIDILSSRYSRLFKQALDSFGAEPWKHLQRQSYKTKLVSAMLNFHAKTEDIGSKHAVSRHSFNEHMS